MKWMHLWAAAGAWASLLGAAAPAGAQPAGPPLPLTIDKTQA